MLENRIYQLLLNSKLSEVLANYPDIDFKSSSLPGMFSEAYKFDNFCIRNYKSILRKLILDNHIDYKLINESILLKIDLEENLKRDFSYPYYYGTPFSKNLYQDVTVNVQDVNKLFLTVGVTGWADDRAIILKNEILLKYNSKVIREDPIRLLVDPAELSRFLKEYKIEKRIFIANVNDIEIEWSEKFIVANINLWDWNSLSENQHLPWSIELIEKYKDKWNYKWMSENPSIPWSIELIEMYQDKWDYIRMSENPSIPWSIELIEKFKNRWYFAWAYLSKNPSIPWSIELIERFKDKWDWYTLTRNPDLQPLSVKLLEQFKDKWYWRYLTENSNLPRSIELIERFKDQWDWGYLSQNSNLPWSIELIEKYKDKWDWRYLSQNSSLPWSIELIEKFKDKWSWSWAYLSENPSIPWSIELIEKYQDQWDWGYLSQNSSLPWSIELIEKFKDKWYWHRLSSNPNLPWSIALIEKYQDQWDWPYVSGNSGIPWSLTILRRYQSRFDWTIYTRCLKEHQNSICSNSGIKWSEEMFLTFREKLDYWLIARFGNFDPNLIVKFEEELDRKNLLGYKFHKFSDCRHSEEIYANGWQNLSINPNFSIDRKLVSFFYKRKTPITYSIKNLAGFSVSDEPSSYATENVRVLQIIREKDNDLTEKDLVDFEFEGTKILLNENFINESIWTRLIFPFINKLGIDVYVSKVEKEFSINKSLSLL